MYCTNCGAKAEGKFCPQCGASLNPQVGWTQDSLAEPGRNRKPFWRKWWFWLLIVVSIVAAGMVYYVEEASSHVQGMVETSRITKKSDYSEAATLAPESQESALVPAAGTAVAAPLADVPVSIEQTVVLNQDGVTVTVTGMGEDSWYGPEVKVLVTNDTANAVTVQVRDVSINGAMVSSIFSCDVAAGKKANDAISFYADDLEEIGIHTIQSIEFRLHIFDSQSWDTLLDSDAITIRTSAFGEEEQTFDDSGFVALDQDGIRFILRGVSDEADLWGRDVDVYLENSTDRDVTIQIRDVSLNGFMMDPIFSCDVGAGKIAYSDMSFDTDALEENGIQDFQTLEFVVHVFDLDSWDTIFDSAPVTATFPF